MKDINNINSEMLAETRKKLLDANDKRSLTVIDLFVETANESKIFEEYIRNHIEQSWLSVIDDIISGKSVIIDNLSEDDKKYIQKNLAKALEVYREELLNSSSNLYSALMHNAVVYSHRALGINFIEARKERIKSMRIEMSQ